MKKLLRITVMLLLICGMSFSSTLSSHAQIEYVPNAGVYINGKVVNGINPIIEDGSTICLLWSLPRF